MRKLTRVLVLVALVLSLGAGAAKEEDCPKSLLGNRIRAALVLGTLATIGWGLGPAFSPDPEPAAVQEVESFPDPDRGVEVALEKHAAQRPRSEDSPFESLQTPSAVPLDYFPEEQVLRTQPGRRDWLQRMRRFDPPRVPARVAVGHSWRYLITEPVRDKKSGALQTEFTFAKIGLEGEVQYAEPKVVDRGELLSLDRPIQEGDLKDLNVLGSGPFSPGVQRLRDVLATASGTLSTVKLLPGQFREFSQDPRARYYALAYVGFEQRGQVDGFYPSEKLRVVYVVRVLDGKAHAFELLP